MGSIQSQRGLRSQNANRMLTLFRKICFDGKNPKSLVPTMKTPETPVKSRVSGVLKGAVERSKCSKRHPLSRTRNQFGSNPTRVRIPPAAPKQKATAFAVAFCFGTHCPKGGSTLRDSNARGGRAAPAPRFCLWQNARTAHSRCRPEGPLEPATLSSIQNIDFTVSLSSEGPLWMSFVFSCLRGKRAHAPQIPNICIQTSYKGINSSLFEWTHSLLPGEG